ncbi:MAG: right-handed parallel beta-helix repeat-containing protein [bacterium]|nr:right-handed parallel beta-helix repeat-containing protein [bacterium]
MRPLVLVLVALLLASVRAADDCARRLRPGDDVQGAVARLGRGGGTLCLGPGEFALPGPLAITRDRVTLRGEGTATVLRLAGGVQAPVVIVGDHTRRIPARPTADVALERLRIVGSGAGDSEFAAAFPYLSNSAVVIRTGLRTTLRGLDVEACRSACIVTEHDTQELLVEDCTIAGSTWDGIALNRTARARIVGNVVRDNTAAGITAEHLEDSVVARNLIRDNRAHGVYLSDSYRNRFQANRFEGNTNAGVFLTCAVRDREPGRVRCWDGSMSAGNTFTDDVFAGNRRTFILAPDAAAPCTRPGFVPNVARDETYAGGPHADQDVVRFGRCLEGPGTDP